MKYKLGNNVEVGNKILLKTGWYKVISKDEKGVQTTAGYIEFGSEIYGWKIK